ncbi:flavin reductase [Nocardiopsis sediminis]|uniref:Flavin reductase n=1 Tax=Nocardiopsis sediminis TaxID=1778267 RepID=A0ABV8FPH7_9ACTN
MSAPAPITVTEYTDPGCVWSWASEPRLRLLRLRYGHLLAWRQVQGMQIADLHATRPGFDPEADAPEFLRKWTAVAEQTGAPITRRLRWMHRSTAPAGRAAIAARSQGPEAAARVLRRLREAVFLRGEPADSPARVRAALAGTPGLDLDRLLADLDSAPVRALQRDEAAEARRVHPATPQAADTGRPTPHPGHPVATGTGHRYGFPTLVLASGPHTIVLPGHRTTEEYEHALDRLRPGITALARPLPDPDDLLAETGTLTQPEVELLAGGRPPAGAIRVPTAAGDVWHPPVPAPVSTGPPEHLRPGATEHDIDPDDFRRALAGHPAGVVVVTAETGDGPAGLTATSFTSVSLSPPLVAFYIADTSSTWARLRHAGHFAVNLLAEDQHALAARFARSGTDRFAAPTAWRAGPHGTPLLEDAAAHLLCRVHETRVVGDHWLVVGRVHGASVHRTDTPLLYHQGAFGGFHPHG